MFDYNIFLPEFTRRSLQESLDFLKNRGVHCEISPKFEIGKKPPFESFALVAMRAPELPNWPFENDTIMTGFNVRVKKFDLKKSEQLQKKKLSNLFGKIKKDDSVLDIELVKEKTDKSILTKLKSCKREVHIVENTDVFASYITAPIFAVAFTLAGKGLIYEGEFTSSDIDVEEDYWPDGDEIDELNEDLKDGETPEYFTGW